MIPLTTVLIFSTKNVGYLAVARTKGGKITIIPNHEKCETVMSSMVFVIGILVFFYRKGHVTHLKKPAMAKP